MEKERKEEERKKKEEEEEVEEEDCVWKKFSHEELERQYSPSRWSRRLGEDVIIERHVEEARGRSGEAMGRVGRRGDLVYDSSLPRGKLDVYGEDLDGASPVLVYVHGGYWQELNKDLSAYLVPPLYQASIVVVIIGYDLAPLVGVKDIVQEVRKGVAWACELAKGRGSVGVVLSGWSAGGQLVTQVLSEEEERSGEEVNPYRDLIRGVVTFSGIFDLRPLVTTYVNDALKLTSEEAWALSPLRSVGKLAKRWGGVGRGGGGGGGGGGLQIFVIVAEEDSPEFIRQSKEYYQACLGEGLRGEFLVVGKTDHFSIVCDLFLPTHLPTERLPKFIYSCCGD
ncbi:kynurenine formamidase-like isoform X2 [Eriocheir sinensis]|uniref:kynurenine formamidase-like isoform X2 n=1 Tax=Eriocheir sinensis TaxID=95602 RepID=UPI0021C933A6|nr:kynurenine formamidase-like isoform X2 [Eriocheir sinensis]